jgi:DNA-3-methyladenine glycosylase I
LFAFLVLEGAQAGLSWLTILKKRRHYEAAFHGFDVERVAKYGARDVARLLRDPGIVRNGSRLRRRSGMAGSWRSGRSMVR